MDSHRRSRYFKLQSVCIPSSSRPDEEGEGYPVPRIVAISRMVLVCLPTTQHKTAQGRRVLCDEMTNPPTPEPRKDRCQSARCHGSLVGVGAMCSAKSGPWWLPVLFFLQGSTHRTEPNPATSRARGQPRRLRLGTPAKPFSGQGNMGSAPHSAPVPCCVGFLDSRVESVKLNSQVTLSEVKKQID